MFTENKTFTSCVRIIPHTVLLFFALTLNAQNVSKYYNSLIQENGILYFIQPDIEFKGEGKMIFDLTHLSKEDSITINLTFISEKLYDLDSICFNKFTVSETRLRLDRIYIDSHKKRWNHRYSARVSMSDFKNITESSYLSANLLTVSKEEICLSTKEKDWMKMSDILRRIFKIIEMNK